MDQIRRFVVNGIKGYEKKLGESRRGVRKLYRTAGESSGQRSRKKLLEKTK